MIIVDAVTGKVKKTDVDDEEIKTVPVTVASPIEAGHLDHLAPVPKKSKRKTKVVTPKTISIGEAVEEIVEQPAIAVEAELIDSTTSTQSTKNLSDKVWAKYNDMPMQDVLREFAEAYEPMGEGNNEFWIKEPKKSDYGTITWANRTYRKGRKCFDELAQWLFNFMLHEDNGDKRDKPLSLTAAYKIKQEQGFEAPFSSAHRWVNALPEYKQLQEGKKANPSSDALRMRAKYEPKNSQSEKPSPVGAEIRDDNLVIHPTIPEPQPEEETAWEDDLLWYGEVEKRDTLLPEEDDCSKLLETAITLTLPGILYITKDDKVVLSPKLHHQLEKEAEERGVTCEDALADYMINGCTEFFKNMEARKEDKEETSNNFVQQLSRAMKAVMFLETALIMPRYLLNKDVAELEKYAKEWLERHEIDPDKSPFLDYASNRC